MIVPRQKITAEEFTAMRPDLPEGGRWHELHAGVPVLLQAPDDAHGTTVLNLSRALGIWFQQHLGQFVSYACHGPGLLVERDPDTVYVPSLLLFDEGPLFGQVDLQLATLVPSLVIEVASSNDRRRTMRERTLSYMHHGVQMIWVADPFKNEVQVIRRNFPTLALGARQSLDGGNVLPDFEMSIADVFAQPDWWTGKGKPTAEDASE
jgi:Uma2 family endonuclease